MKEIEDKIIVRTNDKISFCRGCNKQLTPNNGVVLESPYHRLYYAGLILCDGCINKMMEDLNENNI